MSILSYSALNLPHCVYSNVRGGLFPYRIYLEKQIKCINDCNVIKRVKWKLVSPPQKDSQDNRQKNDIQEQKVQIKLVPNNDNDDVSVFFSDENINQLYEIDIGDNQKKVDWENLKKCKKLSLLDWDEDEETITLKRVPSKTFIAIRPNTYQINKELEAILDLQENPKTSHIPLLRLLDSPLENWPTVNIDNAEENLEWNLLSDLSFPGCDEQRGFVLKVLNTPDFAFLEGPAGSGKTRAICESILQILKQGKRVLLCASTHVAVDNVLERLMDASNPLRDIVNPIRIAHNEKNISSEVAKQYSLKHRVKTEKERIKKALDGIDHREASQDAMLDFIDRNGDADSLVQLILDSSNLVCGTTIGILQHPDIKYSRMCAAAFDYLIIDEASKTTFQEFLVPAMWAKRWILVGDVNQLAPYVDDGELANAIQSYCPEESIRNAVSDIFHIKCFNKNENYNVLVECSTKEDKEIYYHNCPHDKLVDLDRLDKVKKSTGSCIYLGEPRKIQDLYNEVQRKRDGQYIVRFKDRTPFLLVNGNRRNDVFTWETDLSWRLSTIYDLRKSGDSQKKQYLEKDCDELIKLMETVQKNCKLDVRKQIESVRRVALPSILELLCSGFEGADEDRVICRGLGSAYSERAQALSYQHRMHPSIAELSHKYIYKGEALLSPPNMNEKRSNFWRDSNKSKVLWLGRLNFLGRDNDEMQKNTCRWECDLIKKQVLEFVQWAKRHPNSEKDSRGIWSVAVLTFYRGQERLLRNEFRKLRREYSVHIKMDICTIDRFQGHEADLVLISFVKSYATSFLLSQNRLNVALTRARYLCLLVGNKEALKDSLKAQTDEFLYHIVNEIPYEKVGG